MAGLGWYPCGWLKPATRNSNTHRNKNTDQCGDTIEKSQAPDDGCINVRNM